MKNEFLKKLRRLLLAESFYSRAASLSKIINETEGELEDVIEYIDKKVKKQSDGGDKYFKNEK